MIEKEKNSYITASNVNTGKSCFSLLCPQREALLYKENKVWIFFEKLFHMIENSALQKIRAPFKKSKYETAELSHMHNSREIFIYILLIVILIYFCFESKGKQRLIYFNFFSFWRLQYLRTLSISLENKKKRISILFGFWQHIEIKFKQRSI